MPYTNKDGKVVDLASDNCSSEWAITAIRSGIALSEKHMKRVQELLASGSPEDIEQAKKYALWASNFRDANLFLDRLEYLAANPDAPIVHYELNKPGSVQ